MPMLICSEVFPVLSIVLKARSRVGANSVENSWKNSVGMPSAPGALPFGIAEMASWISLNESSLVSLEFMSEETLSGVLAQHSSWAVAVPGSWAFEA